MATRDYCCFKGRGEISLATYAAYIARTAGLKPVGNASVLTVNVSEKTESIPDYVNPAGGTACETREIDKVELAMTLICHTPDNLVRALYAYGPTEAIASGAVAAEPHVLWPGSVEPLQFVRDETVALSVTNIAGTTTYALGADYLITPGGSIKHVEGGSIPAPTVTNNVGQPNVKVTYGRAKQTLIELFTAPSAPVVLHFDGINIASGVATPNPFDLYKVRFGAAANVTLIGDSLSKLELKGTALRDDSRSAGTLLNPFSQYGTLKL